MTDLLAERNRGRAFGEDLRRRAVAAVLDDGMTKSAAGRRFGVHPKSVARWVKRYRERGDLRPDPYRMHTSRVGLYPARLPTRLRRAP